MNAQASIIIKTSKLLKISLIRLIPFPKASKCLQIIKYPVTFNNINSYPSELIIILMNFNVPKENFEVP